MNTIFKFYNQVWVLLAIAGAVMLGKAIAASGLGAWIAGSREIGIVPGPQVDRRADATYTGEISAAGNEIVVGEAIESEGTDREQMEPDDAPVLSPESLMNRRWAWATLLVGAAVILMSLAYPILATGPRLAERFDGHPRPRSLNGYDWMKYGTLRNDRGDVITFSGDRDAIYWFIHEVPGSPVIMEATIGPYRGNGSRFSINTGLPAVIGWGNHETQQRYLPGIGERETDVRDFYNSTDPARKMEILEKYGVEYVIVGDVERYTSFSGNYWADPAGITTIEQMAGTSLEIAFRSGPTTVYRVVNSR